MSSKKQTAVEWYDKTVSDIIQEFVRDEITKTELIVKIHNAYYTAKALEKEQIISANEDCSTNELGELFTGEQYYNENYGN